MLRHLRLCSMGLPLTTSGVPRVSWIKRHGHSGDYHSPQYEQSVQDLALHAVYYFSESPRQGLYSLGQPETGTEVPSGSELN